VCSHRFSLVRSIDFLRRWQRGNSLASCTMLPTPSCTSSCRLPDEFGGIRAAFQQTQPPQPPSPPQSTPVAPPGVAYRRAFQLTISVAGPDPVPAAVDRSGPASSISIAGSDPVPAAVGQTQPGIGEIELRFKLLLSKKEYFSTDGATF
jgi:hypothetical protein